MLILLLKLPKTTQLCYAHTTEFLLPVNSVEANDLNILKELEDGNARLKKLLTEDGLENHTMKEVLKGEMRKLNFNLNNELFP